MNQKKIIKLCKKGDSKGFELLVHQHAPMLMGVCKRYMIDDSTAKDALQNCLISIFRNIEKYEERGQFESWMKKIAVNSSLKLLRKTNKNMSSLSVIQEYDSAFLGENPKVIENINVNSVLSKINSLSEDYRIVINLYIIEGYSYSEISDMLNISEANCRMKVSRARKKLQNLLTEEKARYGIAGSRKVD